ncbi:hypothetical protein WISP_110115 [Willisornis vidua]|uniref:Uncharacterized protein n=1 Tax=Willisornis vidua TaxID=1566151 RepID=A0ABQ9CVX8_9PASS|nr:hypothetical protein WISP_110115 [Willisornis vidua]
MRISKPGKLPKTSADDPSQDFEQPTMLMMTGLQQRSANSFSRGFGQKKAGETRIPRHGDISHLWVSDVKTTCVISKYNSALSDLSSGVAMIVVVSTEPLQILEGYYEVSTQTLLPKPMQPE